MNKDDEWICIDKIIRDINRDMKLAVDVERCREHNARRKTKPAAEKEIIKVGASERTCL